MAKISGYFYFRLTALNCMTTTRTGGTAMVPVCRNLFKISVHPRMSA
jgi:hypothetical protein